MKTIKNFFTALDIFGVTYGFRYKDKEKFQTAVGGFFVLLFFALVIGMGIYYFIPFINRKNYTIVYYTMNLAATEEVNLFASESNFAVGLNCENNDKEYRKINEIFNLKSRYVLYIKSRDGTYHKDATNLDTHKCTYDDFYNKYNSNMDYLGVSNFDCVKDKDVSIQGIFSDQVFSYYEFSVVTYNQSEELIKEAERFLFHNDCKLQFVYTDIIIDLDNYEKPETQYLNEIFIQLNPTLFIKRNIYFMNQYFTNDDYLMFNFEEGDEAAEIKPLYSRYEEYALYKGLDRISSQPEEFDYFTKIYIRAELKRTIIKRKYQKFMEFYADASSLLVAIYEILVIIFNYIDTFYAHHSLAQIIFFFKELENEDSFNVNKKKSKIQEILYVTDLPNKNEEDSIEFDSKGSKVNKFFSPSNKDSERVNVLENNKENQEENQKDIKIYNRKKNQVESKLGKNPSYLKGNEIEDKNEIEKTKTNSKMKSQKNSNDNSNTNSNRLVNYLREKDNILNNDENMGRRASHLRSSKNEDAMMNFRYKSKNRDEYSESQGTNMEEGSSESGYERMKNIKATNSFNIFEIIITEFFKCCMSRSMRIKYEANDKANNILFKKMDIISYVRNMIIFDINNQLTLDNSRRTVMNFICRPVISVKKNSQYQFDEFYRNYKEKDFKKFSEEIQEMAQKPTKNGRENKLVDVTNEHMRDFV